MSKNENIAQNQMVAKMLKMKWRPVTRKNSTKTTIVPNWSRNCKKSKTSTKNYRLRVVNFDLLAFENFIKKRPGLGNWSKIYNPVQAKEALLVETEQKVVQKSKECAEIQKHVDFNQKSVAYNTNLVTG